jgi:hypothetical protein
MRLSGGIILSDCVIGVETARAFHGACGLQVLFLLCLILKIRLLHLIRIE